MRSIILFAGLLTLTLSGCSDPASFSPSLDPAIEDEISLTKSGGKGNIDTDPRARYTFFDVLDNGTTPTRIFGDHRDADGNPIAVNSVYEGGKCGVHGKIFAGGSGDAVLEPADERSKRHRCGAARSLAFSDGSHVVQLGAFMNIGDLYGIREPELPERLAFETDGTLGCDRIRFMNSERGSNEAVTYVERLNSDGSQLNPREWEVSSVAPHEGTCLVWEGTQLIVNPDQPTVYAPVGMFVEEIAVVQR